MASTQQIFIANLYPRCPNPELAMGLPAHSDHGLFTLLVQNGVDGLQIQQKGRWMDASPLPNSILVNTGDHLEVLTYLRFSFVDKSYRFFVLGHTVDVTVPLVLFKIFSNGRYKSVLHRAVVNSERTRISIAMANGPSRDAVVVLVVEARHDGAAAYVPMSYGDYILAQQSNQLKGKTVLEGVTVQD